MTVRGLPKVAWLAVSLLVAACSATPGQPAGKTAEPPTPIAQPTAAGGPQMLSVSNGTTMVIHVTVNDIALAEVPAGQGQDVAVLDTEAAVIPRPWHVVATAPKGRLLLEMDVPPDFEPTGSSGMGVRADMVCGRLDITFGPPMLGPAPDPANLLPCE